MDAEAPTHPDDTSQFKCLSLPEVAELLGVSRRTLRRLIERGDLRAVRVGRQIRLRERELQRLLALPFED